VSYGQSLRPSLPTAFDLSARKLMLGRPHNFELCDGGIAKSLDRVSAVRSGGTAA